MIRNYLKTSLRALSRQKGFTFINVLGLTLGLTCSMLILMWIADEMTFSQQIKASDDLFINETLLS